MFVKPQKVICRSHKKPVQVAWGLTPTTTFGGLDLHSESLVVAALELHKSMPTRKHAVREIISSMMIPTGPL